MQNVSHTFSKAERLKSRKLLDELFKGGQSFVVHPFRVVYNVVELPVKVPVQLAISVPKKRIKKAVDRNRVKRLVREAYRLHKSVHYNYFQKEEKQVALMLIYLGQANPEYSDIEGKIILTLQRLVKKHQRLQTEGSTGN